MASDGETIPLLKRSGTGTFANWKCPTEDERKELKKQFEFPRAWKVVCLNMGMALGYSAYVLTSWLYTTAVYRIMFPPCVFVPVHHTTMENWYVPICKMTALSFWCLPLLCSLVTLGLFYRNCLQMRLYYEMAIHRVHLDYTNIEFFNAYSVRLILVMSALSLSMYWFYDWDYETLVYKVKFTIPYWIPLGSFMGMLYATWDLECQLISMAKIVEKDLDWFQKELPKTYLVRDYVAQQAFENIKSSSPGTSMESWVKALVEECARLEQTGEAQNVTPRLFRILGSYYWVTAFLYNTKLDDKRARDFTWWFRVYKWFVFFMVVCLLYLNFCSSFTVFEGLSTELFGKWAYYLTVEPLVAADPTKITSQGRSTTTVAAQAFRRVAHATTTTLAPVRGGPIYALLGH